MQMGTSTLFFLKMGTAIPVFCLPVNSIIVVTSMITDCNKYCGATDTSTCEGNFVLLISPIIFPITSANQVSPVVVSRFQVATIIVVRISIWFSGV